MSREDLKIAVPILFLTYDRLDWTKQALKVLDRNTQYPCKIIIWDNNSRDGTKRYLLKKLKLENNHIIIYSDRNDGVDKPINEMMRSYKTKFFAKVDNDTLVPKGWLTKMIEEMEREKIDCLCAVHKTMSLSAKGKMDIAREKGFCLEGTVGGSGVVWRREVFEKCGAIPIGNKLIDNWTGYCHSLHLEGLKVGFTGSVEVELLDMADDFIRSFGWHTYKAYNRHIENLRKDVDNERQTTESQDNEDIRERRVRKDEATLFV